MTFKRVYGPHILLGFWQEAVYSPKCVVHLVLKVMYSQLSNVATAFDGLLLQ